MNTFNHKESRYNLGALFDSDFFIDILHTHFPSNFVQKMKNLRVTLEYTQELGLFTICILLRNIFRIKKAPKKITGKNFFLSKQLNMVGKILPCVMYVGRVSHGLFTSVSGLCHPGISFVILNRSQHFFVLKVGI